MPTSSTHGTEYPTRANQYGRTRLLGEWHRGVEEALQYVEVHLQADPGDFVYGDESGTSPKTAVASQSLTTV
ncbi:hypothetical protein ACFWAY_47005 [Rhodococcus sp. NPDC059968]|uniref:hypothetical protein n=1 Tax=Rhodococcus sp. NPDC059968 TaxID=3347017 RepID=UPI00366FF952